MFAKTTRFTVALTLITLVGCGLEETPAGQPPGGQPTLLLVNPQLGVTPILQPGVQSACKPRGTESDGPGESLEGALSFSLEAGGTLRIVHEVEANCAAKIASKATVTLPTSGVAGSVAIEEWVTNPEEAADCICRFDVSTTISGLAPGSYAVTARGPGGELSGPLQITIPAATLPSQQSACKPVTNSGLGSSLTATVQGQSVTIVHDLEANCAAKIVSQATVTPPSAGAPGAIRIEQIVTNPGVSANCICHFDLSTTVEDLPSGSYAVSAADPDGVLAGPVTVTIP